MAYDDVVDVEKLTFSQRERKVELPETMQLEYIPRRFRQLVWRCLDYEIENTTRFEDSDFTPVCHFHNVTRSYFFDVFEEFHDEFDKTDSECTKFIRDTIKDDEYHNVLTLIEFILRHDQRGDDIYESLVQAFDDSPVAYFVKKLNGCPTIIPRSSPESGEAIQEAIKTIHDNGMHGASTHLRNAAGCLNKMQYGDAVRESIWAVESVARVIDKKASKTLGPALDSLEKAGLLRHPALKQAFKKLYGYTSDEQGVRHSLLDFKSSNVGLEEAIFMFGACACFSAFLVNKKVQMDQPQASDQ